MACSSNPSPDDTPADPQLPFVSTIDRASGRQNSHGLAFGIKVPILWSLRDHVCSSIGPVSFLNLCLRVSGDDYLITWTDFGVTGLYFTRYIRPDVVLYIRPDVENNIRPDVVPYIRCVPHIRPNVSRKIQSRNSKISPDNQVIITRNSQSKV